jgi:hypothetical protein
MTSPAPEGKLGPPLDFPHSSLSVSGGQGAWLSTATVLPLLLRGTETGRDKVFLSRFK